MGAPRITARRRSARITVRLGLAATTALAVPLLGLGTAYADGETPESQPAGEAAVAESTSTETQPTETQPTETTETRPTDTSGATGIEAVPSAAAAPADAPAADPVPQASGPTRAAVAAGRLPAAAETLAPPVAANPGKPGKGGANGADETEPSKVVVCKFTQTPRSNELLAHINIVAGSTLKGWDGATFPFAFSDKQGLSKALRFAEPGEQSSDFDSLSPEAIADLCAGAPPSGDLTVLKRDFETGELLAGAVFTVYRDVAPVGTLTADDEAVATVTSDAEGQALVADLAHGDYLVEETAPPNGYADAGELVQRLTVDTDTESLTFHNKADGQLVIVSKQQLELVDGAWLPSDGVVDFGDRLKYVIRVSATGDKLFHDVTVTDYVPGTNPLDVTSTEQAVLVPGSAVCTGDLVCDVVVGEDGLVTWSAGTVGAQSGTVELVVTFPELVVPEPLAETATFTETLWNQAYLSWRQVEDRAALQLSRGLAAAPTNPECPVGFVCSEPQTIASNTVQASASRTIVVDEEPPPGDEEPPPGGEEPPPGDEEQPPPGGDGDVDTVTDGGILPDTDDPKSTAGGAAAGPGGVLPATGAPGQLSGLLLTGLLSVAFGAALTWRGLRRHEQGG